MHRVFGIVLAISALAACGGTSTSPTAASSSSATAPTAPAPPPGGSGPSATITGAVQGASAVSVVGTPLTASVDGGGRFSLVNVPAGSVQMQFSGGGANAVLPLGAVQAAVTIDLVVTVSGPSASIESQFRSGGAESELEGRVESLPPTTSALTFKAAGRTVVTNASTRFQDGSQTRSFADLRIGMRVHVKGSPSGDAIAATLVEMQNSQADVQTEVNGVIDSLTGTAAAFQFKIGSTVLRGDSTTTFFGDGEAPRTFADMKNGLRAEVKGQQRDGFVFASRIHVENTDDPPPPPPADPAASLDGALKAIGGSAPALVLTVNTTTVRMSGATTVKRRGDVQGLDALKVGQTLHVVGTRRTDGSLDARLIEIEDDAEGGEVEIEGAVGGLSGTCPAVTFGINGMSVATNASTTFDGIACSAVKNGGKVQVKGTKQSNGTVLATQVKKS